MGQKFDQLQDKHIEFIERQPLYFVATAPIDGHINLSPKGYDTLKVVAPNRILWLNLVGSGNETAAHLLEDSRMTLMFCSFEDKPLILRTYGRAKAIHPDNNDWESAYNHFSPSAGARQIFDLTIDLVHTSCGFGVPQMELITHRDQLDRWFERKGAEGLERYQQENNQLSLDGKPTR